MSIDSPAADAAPAVRPPQLAGAAPNDPASTVNLFRGEVNFPLKLVSLEGRNGLDVGVTAQYRSSVAADVATWNRDAPTSVLGVGWELGIDRIVVQRRDVAESYDASMFLLSGGSSQQLYRTGSSGSAVAFETREFRFWNVTYYPNDAEPAAGRWEIVKEDGSRWTYGASGAVEVGVSWDNWVGPSIANGGVSFPVAWNLSSIESRQGDRVVFSYEIDEVTIGSAPSARSSRISSITDVFGRRVEFSYALKEPFENQLPWVPPGAQPPAYQFSYQTHYLRSIGVTGAGGALLYRQSFEFAFHNAAPYGRGGDDDFRKRFLSAVRQHDETGREMPALVFEYDTDPRSANPGAITAATYPNGARVSYAYAQTTAVASASAVAIDTEPGFVARVWHGSGFTVITLYNAGTQRLFLRVYSWSGTWSVWEYDVPGNVAAVAVEPSADFFALSYRDVAAGRYAVSLVRRNLYRPADWDVTRLPLGAGFTDVLMAVGPDFVALQNSATNGIDVYQWLGTTKVWDHQTVPTPPSAKAAIGAGNGFVLGAYSSANGGLRFQSFYADVDRRWRVGGHVDTSQSIDWKLTEPDSVWSIGPSNAAATFITSLTGDTVSAAVVMIRWRSGFTLAAAQTFNVSQLTSVSNPILYSTTVQSLTAQAQNLFRYDPSAWSRGALTQPRSGPAYRYAYGDDVALAVSADASGVQSFSALRYDPYSRQWTRAGVPAASPLTAGSATLVPAAAGRGAFLGRGIFTQNSDGTWRQITALPATVKGGSVQLREQFVAYQVSGSRDTTLTFLRNGTTWGAPRVLAGESSYVANPGPGTILAGPDVLLTYVGDSLDAARRFVLHKITDSALPDMLVARSVSAVSLDDGFATTTTYFSYEPSTASFDASGRVARYQTATVRCASESGAFGATVHTFLTGLPPSTPGIVYPPSGAFSNVADYYGLVAGQIARSDTYTASGRPESSRSSDVLVNDVLASGRSIYGMYARTARSIDAVYGSLFTGAAALGADLDAGRFSAALRALFAEYGISASTLVAVTTLRAGRLWKIASTAPDDTWYAESTSAGIVVSGAVSTVATNTYNAVGMRASTTTECFGPSGAVERTTTASTYVWEVYPEPAAANILEPVAMTTRRNETAGVVTGIDVTTWKSAWAGVAQPMWAPHKSYVWEGDAGTQAFDFGAWSGDGEPPAGWLRTNEVALRGARAIALETRDVDGFASSVVYDARGLLPVATFRYASLGAGELSYYGFEAYEHTGPWKTFPQGTDPASLITGGDAFTGARRLELAGSATPTGLRATFTPADPSAPFALTCRVKTATSPVAAGWTVTVPGTAARFTPFPHTGGAWQYFRLVIRAADFGVASISSFSVAVANGDAGTTVLVDDVFVQPALGSGRASVYSEPFLLVAATCDDRGDASWLLYDALQRNTARIGADGMPRELTTAFRWPLRASTFDPAAPNSATNVKVRSGGTYADLGHGTEYLDAWTASAGWAVDDGWLSNAGSAPATLQRKSASTTSSFALAVRLRSATPLQGDLELTIGAGVTLAWRNGTWSVSEGGQPAVPGGTSALDDVDALLLVVGRSLALLVDGAPVVTRLLAAPPAGAFGIAASPLLALANLVTADGVLVDVSYVDNALRAVQTQTLDAGAAIATSYVRDGAQRVAIVTKPVRLEHALFGYRANVVTGFDWTTGVMTGAVADAYPADQGFPYVRSRFEDSPASRIVETGLPGKTLAIDPAVPLAQRRTAVNTYGANVAGGIADDLPAGRYVVGSAFDQDRTAEMRISDALGRLVVSVDGDPASPGARAVTRNVYDAFGRIVEVRQPNFADPALARAASFVVRTAYDYLGRVVSREDPDSDAPTLSVYDRGNRLRFRSTAALAARGELLYWTYDALRRVAEEGVCTAAWDAVSLQSHSDQPQWLPSAGAWSRRYAYDGDLENAHRVGRLWRTFTRNGGDAEIVEETFSYDLDGRVVERAQELNGIDGFAERVGFAYDLLGNVATIANRTDGAIDPERLDYAFDARGFVAALTFTAGVAAPSMLASYDYDAAGAVATENLAPGTAAECRRTYAYDSAGWLTSVADRWFSHSLAYFSGGARGTGSFAGRVARVDDAFTGVPATAGFIDTFSVAFAYDPLHRVVAAVNGAGAHWSMGATEPLTYDANGNALAVERGGVPQTYRYTPGTDRLVTVDGGPAGAYGYDPDGELVSAVPRDIAGVTYDPVLERPIAIDRGDGSRLTFRYAGGGERVLKTTAAQTVVSVPGAADRVAWSTTRDAHGARRRCFFVHGPVGLVATCTSGVTTFAIRDSLGSVRALFDASGLVAAYSYQLFGEPLGAAYERGAVDGLCPFRFTAQPLDAETGLYAFPARLYDPYLGRFYGNDPASQYPSPYLYAGGDPANMVDPTGRFSIGAFFAIVAGIAALAVGVALIVASAGAATPAVAALYGVGGGALAGAGIAGAGYAAMHFNDFRVSDWAINVGFGGLFGAISGGFGLATGAIESTGWTIAAEMGGGAVIGGTDGVVTNGVIDVNDGRNFTDNALSSALSGAGLGAASGALGGVIGRGTAYRNAQVLEGFDNAGRARTLGVYRTSGTLPIGHSVVAVQYGRTLLAFDQVIDTAGTLNARRLLTENLNAEFGRWKGFDPLRASARAEIQVPGHRATAALNTARDGIATAPYRFLRNDCTSTAARVVEATGLRVPPWARTPVTLVWWMRTLR
jgi:RHS repeat-associated protein